MASTSFTFVTKEKFDELIEEYLRVDVNGRRAKLLITQETADMALDVLENSRTTNYDKKFRYHIRNNFATISIDGCKTLVDLESGKAVCLRGDLYDVIGRYHRELQHAGYKKTYAKVSIL